ncbi:MAG TPA: hypothetical protein ENK85_00335 [Saprospiraceae bacterium]|nr:hypothetical protein [Saprospiraceae bacterium]
MKKLTPLLLLIWVLGSVLTSCESKAQKQSLDEQITAINKMLVDSNQQIIQANAYQFVELTQKYIQEEKTDSAKVIKYGIQGAEVAVNLGAYPKALKSYDLLIEKYPNNPKVVSNALFAKAFILENHLHDVDAARKLYLSIQKKYPNQEITKNIKATLENLGKSEAELLEMIKNKQK